MPDRFREQFRAVSEAFAQQRGIGLAHGPGPTPYLYEKGCVIARREAREAVLNVLRDNGHGDPEEQPLEASDVVRFRFGDGSRGGTGGDPDVEEVLNSLRSRAEAVPVTRNHIVGICTANICPGDEPEPYPLSTEEALNPRLACRVRVLVVDTGLVQGITSAYPWMTGVGPVSRDEQGQPHKGYLPLYGGHGSFVAGIVKAVAPHALVEVDDSLPAWLAGAATEAELGDILARELDRDAEDRPAVINLSAGMVTEGNRAPVGLGRFMDLLAASQTVLVCAAGNNGQDEHFYPARYAADPRYRHKVISVGALRGDGSGLACFTNRGDWVSVYAPGERVIAAFTPGDDTPPRYVYRHSTFPECRYRGEYPDCTCVVPRRKGALTLQEAGQPESHASEEAYTGFARWSGTSFATPMVAGMLANHLLANQILDAEGRIDPARAVADLMAKVVPLPLPDGTRVPTLVPATWRSGPYENV
ncbi:S8/S53 family peptidase [Thermoactinospora rubra]|uniref:S8/S53 family peptidase n=1 Tax=Thermoactinospora rubra TaxID=1088767 RepID=UPI000A0FCB60|nr:S8/S53 family peptidase [Thermoactinospora rubra]